jgi:phosphohistidine phosphatase
VLCSSAVRTRQTWDLIRGELVDIEPEVLITDQLYETSVAALLAQLREIDDRVCTVLVVGHEPTLSRTAVRLAGEASDEAAVGQVQLGMSTGTFTVRKLERRWKELERHRMTMRAVVLTTQGGRF